MKITRKRNVINKAGIFAGSLFVAASAVYLYSPVIGSYADTAVVGAEVNAMIALTTPENLRLEVTPSAAGATASDSITATVNTNSSYGYELYFSATDTNTDMTSTSSTATITSDFTTTSLANIPANSWGYSLDDTDYSPIPTSENSTRIRSIEHLPAGNELTTSIHFGTKVDSTLASGFYSDDVVFSAVAIAPPEPIIPSMQNFESSMLPNKGDTMQLKDERDGTMYDVARLTDGKVWMAQNLKIMDKTITSEDSNLPSGETFTIPASDISAFTEEYNTSAAYLDDTHGGYYNFYTATAGWGTHDKGDYEQSTKDICPKGWRLPIGYDDYIDADEFERLRESRERIIEDELIDGIAKFDLAGLIHNGEFDEDYSYLGYYWYGTSFGEDSGDALLVANSYTESATGIDKYKGLPVRCIANEPTMQAFDKTTMLPDVGDSMEIRDNRDGSKYTIKRLADGNVWMTDNLRLDGRTGTPLDSNIVEYTHYIYVDHMDETYGGYYNFQFAVADSQDGLTTGNAPEDICPKGWRLPTGGNSGELGALYGHYGVDALITGEPAFTLSGGFYSGELLYRGETGEYWSSTINSADTAFSLSLNNSSATMSADSMSVGKAVRCIAK